MKNIFVIALYSCAIILNLGCTSSKSNDKTSNAVQIFMAWPGYEYLPFYSWKKGEKEPTGIEPALIKAILDKNNIEYEFIPNFRDIDDDPRIDAIVKNRADISIRCMSITDERKKLVNFSDPYYVDGVGVLVLKDSRISTKEDLEGKRVYVTKYTTSFNWLTSNVSEVQIVTPTQSEFLKHPEQMLDSSLIDAFILDYSYLQTIQKANSQYKLLNQKFTQEPWGIAVHKDRKDLLQIINTTLAEMKESGELERIFKAL